MVTPSGGGQNSPKIHHMLYVIVSNSVFWVIDWLNVMAQVNIFELLLTKMISCNYGDVLYSDVHLHRLTEWIVNHQEINQAFF